MWTLHFVHHNNANAPQILPFHLVHCGRPRANPFSCTVDLCRGVRPLASSLHSSYDNGHCRCKTCPCKSSLFLSSQSIASRCAPLPNGLNFRFGLRTSSAKRTERLRSQARRNTQSSQSFSATGQFSCHSLTISHACSLFS